jgi:hypothetical protein
MHRAERAQLFNGCNAVILEAFSELALLTFIELVEDAAAYTDAFQWFDEEAQEDACEDEDEHDADTGYNVAGGRSRSQRTLALALASGYVLRTKAGGWKLFCERLTVPPFALVDLGCEADMHSDQGASGATLGAAGDVDSA